MGPQDGRHRRNHGAMAATLKNVSLERYKAVVVICKGGIQLKLPITKCHGCLTLIA